MKYCILALAIFILPFTGWAQDIEILNIEPRGRVSTYIKAVEWCSPDGFKMMTTYVLKQGQVLSASTAQILISSAYGASPSFCHGGKLNE